GTDGPDRRGVKLSADQQSVQWLQSDAGPHGDRSQRAPRGLRRALDSTSATGPPPGSLPARGWRIRGWISPARYWTLAGIGLVIPLAIWALLSAFGAVNPVFLPGPLDVVRRVGVWLSDGDLFTDVRISFFRVVAGWALSALIAMPLGLL